MGKREFLSIFLLVIHLMNCEIFLGLCRDSGGPLLVNGIQVGIVRSFLNILHLTSFQNL